MKAMLLSAGRGERMRPLTDHTPKPLLMVGGEPLIVHTMRRLVAADITDLVINHSYLGEQIEQVLGDGHAWGATIHYSHEAVALETAGGIIQALPLLGDKPFVVVNGDIWTDYDFSRLRRTEVAIGGAHLVLVANPEHHPQGDFSLADGKAGLEGPERLTFSGIGLYSPRLFAGLSPGTRPLAPLLREAIIAGRVSAEFHTGQWLDIGTPERLQSLDRQVRTTTGN